MEFHVDWIGYAASFFVVISFALGNNPLKMRGVNLIGAVLFVIYGFGINNWPIIIPNGFLIGIQSYYMYKIIKNDG